MSTQIIAVIVILLGQLLPYIGIEIGTEQLTQSFTTIVTVLSGVWIWYQRTTLQKAPGNIGDVTIAGLNK